MNTAVLVVGGLLLYSWLKPGPAGATPSTLATTGTGGAIQYWYDTVSGRVVYRPGLTPPGLTYRPASEAEIARAVSAPNDPTTWDLVSWGLNTGDALLNLIP